MSIYWLVEHKFCDPRRYAKFGAMQRIEWVADPLEASRFVDKVDAEWHAKCGNADGEPCVALQHMSLIGPNPKVKS